jgi:hypothetical protein
MKTDFADRLQKVSLYDLSGLRKADIASRSGSNPAKDKDRLQIVEVREMRDTISPNTMNTTRIGKIVRPPPRRA